MQHLVVTGYDGKIYVFGGRTARVGLTDAVRIYNPATNSWSMGAARSISKKQFDQ